jgi:hypothetical protein
MPDFTMIDPLAVMAGLVPAIHVCAAATKKDVDARNKSGHDESGLMKLGINPSTVMPRDAVKLAPTAQTCLRCGG